MRLLAAILCIGWTLCAALSGSDGQRLAAELRQIEAESGGVLGLAAVQVETGASIGWRAKERFPLGGAHRLPVSLRTLAFAEAGVVPFRKWFKLEPKDYSTGHSPLRDAFPEGVVRTTEQLLILTLKEDDHTACDFLMRQVGGPEGVNGPFEKVTQGGIRLSRTDKEMDADFERMGAQAFAADGRDSATPEAMTGLLMMVHRGQILKPKTRETMLAWLSVTESGRKRIGELLPDGATMWHLPATGGTKDGVNLCTNDLGLVKLPDSKGDILLSVFLKLSVKDEGARERAIAQAAQAVYRYFAEAVSK